MAEPAKEPTSHLEEEPPPPLFKTWGQMYAFVLIMHAIIIALFYWFTVSYS
jgi:hypothetical protein